MSIMIHELPLPIQSINHKIIIENNLTILISGHTYW